MDKRLFQHDAGSVTFSRFPRYPVYEFYFDQAVETTFGGKAIAFPPIAQRLLIHLSWPRMSGADKTELETFFKTVTKGTAEPFTYVNAATGDNLLVRFADAELAVMPEVAFDQYEVSLSLRSAESYGQFDPPAGDPAAIPGSRFILGSCVAGFPTPLKTGSGSALARIQPTATDSDGDLVVYDRGQVDRVNHALEIRHDLGSALSLQSFLIFYAHGGHKPFTWIDQDGTSRTVRLSGGRFVVRQLGVNRYQTSLNLLEELSR